MENKIVIAGLTLILLITGLSGCVENYSNTTTNYYHGIILINENSEIASFANNLSEERGWILLQTESSNPKIIRQDIVNITNKYPITYLLIIGNESTIPIIDYETLEYFLHDRELVPPYELGRRQSSGAPYSAADNVLDSIYYGNIDDDPYIELAVGRLPFNDLTTIKNYYKDLEMDKKINNISSIRSSSSPGPVSIITIKQKFKDYTVDNFITENITIDEINTNLNNSDLFFLGSHGSSCCFYLDDGIIYNMNMIPNLIKRRPIFISGACSTSKEFGKEFIKRGGSAYIGNYLVSKPDPNVFPIRPNSEGETIGLSLKNALNKNIVSTIFTGNIVFPTLYYLIGDPSIKITCQEKNISPKLRLQSSTNDITVIIPPFEKEIINLTTCDNENYSWILLAIDGNRSAFNLDIINLPPEIYNTIESQGYYYNDDYIDDDYPYTNPEEPLILVECIDTNSTTYQCIDVNNDNKSNVGDLKERFNIDIPYDYVVDYSGYTAKLIILNISKKYDITNYHMEIDGQPYSLSSSFNYSIKSGNDENFLVINIPLNDIFDMIHNGGLFKEKKIVFNIEDN